MNLDRWDDMPKEKLLEAVSNLRPGDDPSVSLDFLRKRLESYRDNNQLTPELCQQAVEHLKVVAAGPIKKRGKI